MAVSSGRRKSPPPAAPPVQALALRRFNRFYTRQIGLLEEHLVRSPFSLAEARVLYELAQRERTSARALSADLGLDPGYLSRILRGLRRRGLLRAQASPADGRQVDLSLTDRGRRTFAELDRRSTEEVLALLERLPEGGRRRLVDSMRAIEGLLSTPTASAGPLVLRAPLPGDLGYVIHRHGVLYAREHGYDATFEGLVARIVADFAEKQDPARDRCILAERAGEILGAVFLMKESATVGRLRLFYVEPEARGQGIGARLVDECLRFARQAGYRRVVLWTQGDLHAARHLYEKAGFRRVSAKPHRSFGRQLVGENWELVL